MDNNPPPTLEELIHRELSSLPEWQAPPTLIPAVLERIRAREKKCWWQRSWSHWPFAIRLASIPFMMMGVLGAIFGLSHVWGVLMHNVELTGVEASFQAASAIWEIAVVLGGAVLVLCRALAQQWLMLLLLVPLIMYVACVGLGTLCYRIAYQSRR